MRWGRLFLDHDQAEEAAGLFQEALELKKDHAGALLGLALIAADAILGRRPKNWRGRLWPADPKLIEAQELLARLALEDNDNAKAEAEAKKALAIDSNSVEGRAILAVMDWLADRKETSWDPHEARGYETAGHFFMINRRYEEAIEYYRKAIVHRSAVGQRALRAGHQPDAPGPQRRGVPAARDLLQQRLPEQRYPQQPQVDG